MSRGRGGREKRKTRREKKGGGTKYRKEEKRVEKVNVKGGERKRSKKRMRE